MNGTVGHFRDRYLQLTETFIYQYLTNHDRYEPYVSALYEENLDNFPFEPRYTLPERDDTRPWDRLSRRLPDTPFGHPFYGRVIDEHSPDITHAHFGSTGATLSAYRRDDRPLVTSFYGYDVSEAVQQSEGITDRLKAQYYKQLYKPLFRRGDLFLVEGPAMREKLLHLGCPPEKIKLQRIAIDTSRIEPRYPETVNTVLMVGRFAEKKGMPDGIRAFAEVFAGTDVQLRIVGGGATDGYSREELARLAANCGVGDQVIFTGYLPYDEYLEEVNSCDVLLAPSKTASSGDSEGGAPTVLLEAQAAGKPIVSTTHADIPYVVINGTTGLLSSPGDVRELADSIGHLRDDPSLLSQLGQKGRENMIERHDVSTLVVDLENRYDSVRK
jgi:colanic acid/amylovoran biosynthesis glycosyltransferase